MSFVSKQILKSKGSVENIFDIAPLGEGTSPQKRSGMARFVNKFHSFAITAKRLFANEPTCLFSSRSWSSFTGGMEG